MTDNIVRREVQRRDDPFGIPACFYWTIDEVADWIESIGYGKYKENFRSHFINGRKLLTVDACVLPKMGITHFGDILTLAKLIRDQLHIRKDRKGFDYYKKRKLSISLNHPCGHVSPHISFQKHMLNTEPIITSREDYFRKRNIYYSGWSMERWWDLKLRAEEKEKKEKLKHLPEAERPAVTIGETMQDRLREASRREITFTEPKIRKPKRRKFACMLPMKPVLTRNLLNCHIIGQLNISPVNVKRKCPEKKKKEGKEEEKAKKAKEDEIKFPDPYLPVIFHWKEMETTKGFPQLRLDKNDIPCGYYTGN